ncbi:sugar ABC transporter ATP-binding protein [[Clostridium] cellulosi]
MPNLIIEMKAIEKSFYTNKVLHGVDFTLEKGSIHALLGENGTGKSTLMNILGGVISCDKGEIFIDGNKKQINSPSAAKQEGIAFIHQELTLINDLTVFENLFLGRELKKNSHLDKKSMISQAQSILDRIEIDLDPRTMVRDLNASYKQTIEIARALMENARVIIMDEPTSSLTDVEVEHIFKIMRSLKKQGVSFVFISHKLDEVMRICDTYTVMRDGRVVANGSVDETVNEAILAKYMVGKDISTNDFYRPRQLGDVILELKHLSRDREFSDINCQVRKGEVVGFTGLLGDGRSEVFSTVFGCNKKYQGEIYVNGKLETMHSTWKAKSKGISYLPRNRKENGIVKDLSVGENMTLSILKQLSRMMVINTKQEKSVHERYIKDLEIKVSDVNDLITSLSGGNQQKVVLAKALASNPQIVILDNPTQGVDVGAKLEIYNIIMKLAETGISFVVLSSEIQEILNVCDRIYVMYHGKIKAEYDRKDASEENIMVAATGGTVEKIENGED